jgi:hypothetical protein
MTHEEKRKTLIEALENLDEWQIVEIWNEYCDCNNYEEHVYRMEEFDELSGLEGESPLTILEKAQGFDTNAEWWWFSRFGYESGDPIEERQIDLYDLAEWLLRHGAYRFLCSDIRDILESFDEEEEETDE